MVPSASRQASHEPQNQPPPMISISPPAGLAGATSLRNILAAKSSTLDLSRVEWLYGKKVSVGGGGSNCQLHVSLRSKIPADSPISFGESEALALLRLLFVEDIQEFRKAEEEKRQQQPSAVRETWKCHLAPKRKNILQLVRLLQKFVLQKQNLFLYAPLFVQNGKRSPFLKLTPTL